MLYEDPYHAAVFKPAGFHACGRHWKTLAHALPAVLDPRGTDEPDAIPPAPVHRLDARVCGVLLVSKTRRATAAFARMLERPAVAAAATGAGLRPGSGARPGPGERTGEAGAETTVEAKAEVLRLRPTTQDSPFSLFRSADTR